MLSEFDKWPLLLQILASIGAVAGGAFMYLRGAKAKPESDVVVMTSADVKALRKDLGDTLEALKTSLQDQFEAFDEKWDHRWEVTDERLRAVELKVAVLYDRHDRNPERGTRGR